MVHVFVHVGHAFVGHAFLNVESVSVFVVFCNDEDVFVGAGRIERFLNVVFVVSARHGGGEHGGERLARLRRDAGRAQERLDQTRMRAQPAQRPQPRGGRGAHQRHHDVALSAERLGVGGAERMFGASVVQVRAAQKLQGEPHAQRRARRESVARRRAASTRVLAVRIRRVAVVAHVRTVSSEARLERFVAAGRVRLAHARGFLGAALPGAGRRAPPPAVAGERAGER